MKPRDRLQSRLAQEAARIMIEEGVEDYTRAKLKAANRVGRVNPKQWPCNDAIDLAREEYLRIYRTPLRIDPLPELRRIALEIMTPLAHFSPRLVGDIADGCAGPHSPVVIHLFPDAAEDVICALIDLGIPFQQTSFPKPGEKGRSNEVPGLRFFAGACRVDVLLLSPDERARLRGRLLVERRLSLDELRRRVDVDHDEQAAGCDQA